MSNRNILQALQSAGGAGGAGLDVDNVFSVHVYEGNGATQDISNGINLNTTGTTIGFTTTTLNYFTSSNLGLYGSEEYKIGKIIEDSSGNFYALIRFKNTANNQQQNTVTKFSSAGLQVWSYRIQDTGSPQYAEISDILFNSAGNIAVYWMPAGVANYLRINIIDKDSGSILAKSNNSSGSTNMENALQSGTNLYWVGQTNGTSLFINSDTAPDTEVVSRRVDLGSYSQRLMLIPQSDNEPILVSAVSDSNSGTSTNGWVFTKLSSNLQSEEFSTRHSHGSGSSTQYSSQSMTPGKQYYDSSDNMLYTLWYGVNSYSGNTSYVNYISKFDMDDGSHVVSKRVYFNNNSTGNVEPQSITKFGSSIICVVSGHDGSNTQHIIMEFNSSLTNLNTRTVQFGSYNDRLQIYGGSSSLFYFASDHASKAQIVKFSEFNITEPILGVTPATGGVTVTSASLTNTTTGYVNISPTFNAASDSMGGGSNLTSNTVSLVTNSSVTAAVEEVGTGGLVWSKDRDTGTYHTFTDTVRGGNQALYTSATNGNTNRGSDFITSFNFNGYSVGADGLLNDTNSYVSWTFKKHPKFFDIVTYNGNSQTSQTIAHLLGSAPGMMLVKRTDDTGIWWVYHRDVGATKFLRLQTTGAQETYSGAFNDTAPTATHFTVGSDSEINYSGRSYIAYLFAHNDGDGDFGPKGNQDIIKCGSYTGNGSGTGPVIDLGFEPQWVLIKASSHTANWFLYDTMRGIATSRNDATLYPDSTAVEANNFDVLELTATGFNITYSGSPINDNNATYIYMAIRKGPLFVPEDATKVFEPTAYTGDGTISRQIGSINPVDLVLVNDLYNNSDLSGYGTAVWDRLRGENLLLRTNGSDADSTGWQNTYFNLDQSGGWRVGDINGGQNYLNKSSSDMISWTWKRAPGYFDIVAYTGTGVAGRTVNHSLGVEPEMIWVKTRSNSVGWAVYNKTEGFSKGARLELDGVYNTETNRVTGASSTTFTVGIDAYVNTSARTYIAYLFATAPGVSKVGSVTHSGTTNVDCGFAAGSRFVLLKRTDASGGWYIWDSVRGIVSGNDPYLLLNTTAAEVTNTDYIDPLSSGFTITSSLTAGDYIFYAVA